jgi:hypothetical protein
MRCLAVFPLLGSGVYFLFCFGSLLGIFHQPNSRRHLIAYIFFPVVVFAALLRFYVHCTDLWEVMFLHEIVVGFWYSGIATKFVYSSDGDTVPVGWIAGFLGYLVAMDIIRNRYSAVWAEFTAMDSRRRWFICPTIAQTIYSILCGNEVSLGLSQECKGYTTWNKHTFN